MDSLVALGIAAGEATGDPVSLLLQYGVLGIFSAVMLIYTRSSITRERQKGDKAEAKVDELNEFIKNELLPKQIEAAVLHKQIAEVLEEAIQLITEMKIRDSVNRPDSGSSRTGGRRG